MKNIYNAPNKEVAAAELDNLEKKWGGKYPYAILSWRNKWDDLTVFFQFPLEIRKIIYTTNRHYKIFCVNGNTGFRNESRIFYFIHLQNEEAYERKESSSA